MTIRVGIIGRNFVVDWLLAAMEQVPELRPAAIYSRSAETGRAFAEKYHLPFILLSDPELQAIQAYGVWQEKKLYGKVSMGVVRSTYLIDEQGMIEKVMTKVKPDINAGELLAYLEAEEA